MAKQRKMAKIIKDNTGNEFEDRDGLYKCPSCGRFIPCREWKIEPPKYSFSEPMKRCPACHMKDAYDEVKWYPADHVEIRNRDKDGIMAISFSLAIVSFMINPLIGGLFVLLWLLLFLLFKIKGGI